MRDTLNKYYSYIENGFILYGLSFVYNLILILVIYASLNEAQIGDFFINSDQLYLPQLYKDIFIDKLAYNQLQLNASPGFFPDLLIYYVVRLFTSDIIFANFLYSVFQYFLILIFSGLFIKTILPRANGYHLALVNCLMSLFLLISSEGDFRTGHYILSESSHTGNYIMILLCATLSIRYFKSINYLYLVPLLILGIFGVISDKIFIIGYLIPFAVCSLMFYLIRLKIFYLVHLINVVFQFLAGITVLSIIKNYTNIPDFDPFYMQAFKAFKYMNQYLLQTILNGGFTAMVILLSAMVFLGHLIMGLIKQIKGKLVDETSLINFAIIITAFMFFLKPIIFSENLEDNVMQSVMPAFYILVIAYVPLFSELFTEKRFRQSVTVISMVFVIVGGMAFSKINLKSGLNQFFEYRPVVVDCIDGAKEKYDLNRGIGDEKIVRLVNLFSNKNIEMISEKQAEKRAFETDNDITNFCDFMLLSRESALVCKVTDSPNTLSFCGELGIMKLPNNYVAGLYKIK